VRVRVRLRVNGEPRAAEVEPRLLLSDFLRDVLGLTGTHVGCEMGACGACTVIVEGEPVRACLFLAVQADGADVRTVESLGTPEALHPLQQAFREHHALQCGYCTPGILMTVLALAERGELPAGEEDVRAALAGNLCRCTGYQNIVDAILAYAGRTPAS
jgi:aerobic-type carbon monoxide dehydrogenase small subunit (CoxS/CutS family)